MATVDAGDGGGYADATLVILTGYKKRERDVAQSRGMARGLHLPRLHLADWPFGQQFLQQSESDLLALEGVSSRVCGGIHADKAVKAMRDGEKGGTKRTFRCLDRRWTSSSLRRISLRFMIREYCFALT